MDTNDIGTGWRDNWLGYIGPTDKKKENRSPRSIPEYNLHGKRRVRCPRNDRWFRYKEAV